MIKKIGKTTTLGLRVNNPDENTGQGDERGKKHYIKEIGDEFI